MVVEPWIRFTSIFSVFINGDCIFLHSSQCGKIRNFVWLKLNLNNTRSVSSQILCCKQNFLIVLGQFDDKTKSVNYDWFIFSHFLSRQTSLAASSHCIFTNCLTGAAGGWSLFPIFPFCIFLLHIFFFHSYIFFTASLF